MWWTGQVCYKLNCTTHLSSATPSKVTWIQWPLWGEKVSLHEKLKEHLVLKLWWWTGQVCYKLNCTTDLWSATPSKVTWIQWPLWGEKVSLHEKLKEHLVLKLWWWTGQVCYKLNCMTDLSSVTPSKVTWIQWLLWGEKVSLHEKLKEYHVLKLWWWTGQVCYKLNCTTDLSSATPSKVTWIQWPLWGEKVSLHEKLKDHLVLKLWWWTGQVCYKLNYTPVKCHALQGHVNPMTPLRWKGVTAWKASCPQVMVVNGASVLQIELYDWPVKCHALQGHVNPMTPLRWKGVTAWKASCPHVMVVNGASVLQIELYTCQVPRPPRSR